jgi:hypothetical protein
MRVVFPIVALAIVGLSVSLDHAPASPDSRLCRDGLCRYDQMFAAIDAHGMDLGNVSALLNQDASNPLVWCTYAELLSGGGQTAEAAAAFEHAVTLSPGMSPVLMRAANFDFANGRVEEGLALTNRILGQTDAFDQVLFSYLTHSGLAVSELAAVAVPPMPRPAGAWFAWLRNAGSDEDLRELWSWMRKNQLVDQKLATDFAWAFWQRKAFASAQESWADWLGPKHGDYLHPQRLANVHFEDTPNGSPFDWTLMPGAGVEIRRNNGLEIRFSGTENVAFSNVHQFATVTGGRYRFSAEIGAEEISTDQGPFFHVFDPANPGRVNVESSPIKGTVARSWITLEVPVPRGTQALQIQIERRPSQKFDNKIGGTLHVYQVSLVPAQEATRQ